MQTASSAAPPIRQGPSTAATFENRSTANLRAQGRTQPHGFTLLEIIAVLAIIAILASLAFFAIGKSKAIAEKDNTASTISLIKSALTLYRTEYGTYPSGPGLDTKTWPDPYDCAGVELDGWFLKHISDANVFTNAQRDPADRNYLVDHWRRRIRYRKTGRDSYLVWSLGPDGVDEIGLGNQQKGGDDITSASVE